MYKRQVLQIDRTGAAERRAASTGSVHLQRKPAPHYERDEYPPAFVREGGHNANVRFIDRHDNRGAGAVTVSYTHLDVYKRQGDERGHQPHQQGATQFDQRIGGQIEQAQ